MGFLAIIPSILAVINKVLPNVEDQNRARLELMRIIEENKYKAYEIEVRDKSSARSMYTRQGGWTVPILAWLVIIGFFGLCACWFCGVKIPMQQHDVCMILIGTVAAKFSTIVDFFFGSSNKQETDLSDKLRSIAEDRAEVKAEEKEFKIK